MPAPPARWLLYAFGAVAFLVISALVAGFIHPWALVPVWVAVYLALTAFVPAFRTRVRRAMRSRFGGRVPAWKVLVALAVFSALVLALLILDPPAW